MKSIVEAIASVLLCFCTAAVPTKPNVLSHALEKGMHKFKFYLAFILSQREEKKKQFTYNHLLIKIIYNFHLIKQQTLIINLI